MSEFLQPHLKLGASVHRNAYPRLDGSAADNTRSREPGTSHAVRRNPPASMAQDQARRSSTTEMPSTPETVDMTLTSCEPLTDRPEPGPRLLSPDPARDCGCYLGLKFPPDHPSSVAKDGHERSTRGLNLLHIPQLTLRKQAAATRANTGPGNHRSIAKDGGKAFDLHLPPLLSELSEHHKFIAKEGSKMAGKAWSA